MNSTINLTSNSTNSLLRTKSYLKGMTLVFNLINEYDGSLNRDELLTNAMEGLVYFVNNGDYDYDNFEEKVISYIRDYISTITFNY